MAGKGPVIAITITSDDKSAAGFDSASRKADGWGGKMTAAAAGAGAAIGAFALDAGKQLVAAAGDWVNLAREAEIFDRKADTVFGSSATDIKKWADQVNESFGLSDEAVVGMAASMGDLLKPMGFTEEATAKMTKEMVGQAGALAAWSGGKYDAAEVSDIMTKALLGETDGLKALGISISAAEVEQKALAMTGKKSASELTAQERALATQALMMEKSTDATKAWNDGTMDSVKQQNAAKAAWEDAKTSLGNGLLPIVQGATEFFVNNLIPAAQSVVAEFKENWPAIKETVMSVVQPIMDWFVANWPVIRDTVVEAMTNIQIIVETVLGVVQALWDAFGSYVMTYVDSTFEFIRSIIEAAMNVVKGIIDVVMGLITGDWGRAWDGVKSILQGVWDAIGALVQLAIDQVKLILQIAWDGIKLAASTAWEGIKTGISTAIDSVVNFVTGIPERIGDTVSTVWQGLLDEFTSIKDGIGTAVDDIVGFVTGIPGSVASAISGGFDSIWDGFRSVINKIIDGWNNLDFPDIKIPSIKIPLSPDIPGFTINMPGTPNIPRLATGGIVRARPGGILANIGEGRWDEAVIPLDGRTSVGGTVNQYVTNNFPPSISPQSVAVAMRDLARRGHR